MKTYSDFQNKMESKFNELRFKSRISIVILSSMLLLCIVFMVYMFNELTYLGFIFFSFAIFIIIRYFFLYKKNISKCFYIHSLKSGVSIENSRLLIKQVFKELNYINIKEEDNYFVFMDVSKGRTDPYRILCDENIIYFNFHIDIHRGSKVSYKYIKEKTDMIRIEISKKISTY